MDDGRTQHQRRCRKTWKRTVVDFGESAHFRPVGENNAMRGGDQSPETGEEMDVSEPTAVWMNHRPDQAQ